MNNHPTCPLCERPLDKPPILGVAYYVECNLCGIFYIPNDVYSKFDFIVQSKSQKLMISAFTKEALIRKQQPPDLNQDAFEYILSQAPRTPIEKVDRLLVNLTYASAFPGADINLAGTESFNLGYCENPAEFALYRQALINEGYITAVSDRHFRVTVDGWRRVETLQRTNILSDQAFVAMNFDKKFDLCYENAIKKAIEETGYKPYRIDREEHGNRIDDKILAEIKRSKFIIAEFTGQKYGVYFEAGYASGLGIPVIWACMEDDLKNLHFDTRQYNHIVWTSDEELKEKLINRIRVMIGDNA